MSTLNEPAPSFELKNTNKELVSLDSYKGKTVVLTFCLELLLGCDTEICAFNDQMSKLNDLNATVLGVSVDSPWANGAFKDKYGFDLDYQIITEKWCLPTT